MSVDRVAMQPKLPRVAITYCTKCRWLLRAAYFAQELLTTFETKIGEVSLIPTVGGIFEVNLTLDNGTPEAPETTGSNTILIWDFKSKRCFPETKVLKQLIRDHIEPDRDLGHSDRKTQASTQVETPASAVDPLLHQARVSDVQETEHPVNDNSDCADCR